MKNKVFYKRLTIITLLFCLISDICAFASNGSILKQLKIMSLKNDYHVVTKGEFSQYIANIIGDNMPVVDNLKITDEKMSEDYEYKDAINKMIALGIIVGNDYNQVNADRPLTYNEAVKMVVCFLGYNDYAYNRGGYPIGYTTTARELGLLKNLTQTGNLWLEEIDAMHLLTNALKTPMLTVTGYGSSGYLQFGTEKDITPAYEYLGLKYKTGVITSVKGISGIDGTIISDDAVFIDHIAYKSTLFDENDMGLSVDFYFDENNRVLAYEVNEKGTVISSNIQSITINSDEIVVYDEFDKKNRIKVDFNTDIIFNKSKIPSLATLPNYDTDPKGYYGSVKAIDNDSDGKVDFLFIDYAYDFLIGSVNAFNETIYDKNNPLNSINLSLSTRENVRIFDEESIEMEFEDITAGALYSIVESIDGKNITLLLQKAIVEGNVSQSSSESIIIDNELYKVTKYYNTYYTSSLGINKKYIINHYGYISAISDYDNLTSKQIGYLIRIKYYRREDSYECKILNSNGTILNLKMSEKIRFNDVKQTPQTVYNTPSVSDQLIMFKCDSDGNIREMETANASLSATGLKQVVSLSGAVYMSASKNYGGKVVLSNDAKIFFIPTGTDSWDSDYKVVNATEYLLNNHTYSLEAYTTGTNPHTSNVLIERFNSMSLPIATDAIGIYDNGGVRKVDEYGDIVQIVKIYELGIPKEYQLRDMSILTSISDSSGAYSLKRGDVIQYKLDPSGNICSMKLLYRADTKTVNGTSYNGAWSSRDHYKFCYAYDSYDGTLWTCDSYPTGSLGISNLTLYPIVNVVVYDTLEDKIIQGRTEDISDYVHARNSDEVFIQSVSGAVKMIYVVK